MYGEEQRRCSGDNVFEVQLATSKINKFILEYSGGWQLVPDTFREPNAWERKGGRGRSRSVLGRESWHSGCGAGGIL